jgi:hypothetical protein
MRFSKQTIRNHKGRPRQMHLDNMTHGKSIIASLMMNKPLENPQQQKGFWRWLGAQVRYYWWRVKSLFRKTPRYSVGSGGDISFF